MFGSHLVGVPVSGVDAAVLVVELNGTGAGLGDGEATGLGLDVLDLVPFLLGHVLGDQGVGGLDDREFSRHNWLLVLFLEKKSHCYSHLACQNCVT